MTQKGTDNEKGAESSLETKPNNQKSQNSLVIVTAVDICPTTVPRIQLISKKQSQKGTKECCLLGKLSGTLQSSSEEHVLSDRHNTDDYKPRHPTLN